MNEPRFEEFKAAFEADGKDPERVVKLIVRAMLEVERDPDLARQQLALIMSKKELVELPGSLTGFCLRRPDEEAIDRLVANVNIARSYAGATPGGDYQDFDPAAPRVELDRAYSASRQGVDYPEPGRAKFFVRSSGADFPRPVSLARNKHGVWKVTDWNGLAMGVREPAGDAGDF